MGCSRIWKGSDVFKETGQLLFFVITMILTTTLANLYSGLVISYFTVAPLSVLPKSLTDSTQPMFEHFPIVTFDRDRSKVSYFHLYCLQQFIDQSKYSIQPISNGEDDLNSKQ